MKISIIWAMDENRLISVDNSLPWKLPADMQWFRRNTLGKPIIMGRKTFESFGGKPLPQRHNIVITRDRDYVAEGATVVHSIDEALQVASDTDNAAEAMIIGGAMCYEQMLTRADRLYITLVHGQFAGDAWFPEFDMGLWREVEREEHAVDERNGHACSFIVMERL